MSMRNKHEQGHTLPYAGEKPFRDFTSSSRILGVTNQDADRSASAARLVGRELRQLERTRRRGEIPLEEFAQKWQELFAQRQSLKAKLKTNRR